VAAINRERLGVSRIIPGDWGKDGPGWLARPLWKGAARRAEGGRIHQFLWRRSRAVSNANRDCAIRRNKKLRTVESSNPGWFRARVNRSYQRVNGCYCAPARVGCPGGLREEVGQRKTPKGGTKRALAPGRTRGHGRTRENLPRSQRW
jgi:hypothetical protein